ncbi:hypothetical protein OG552_36230 [Streptomyces sp. NBC_01476]|uniref:NACHT domain-containing protein n=1 Tax=Streptomyces sp. NBC_01476 TaxID=2903881 RepID=UPI002E35DDC4|nr:hypothetical protein [Streptomyces sp. NBC_01476]
MAARRLIGYGDAVVLLGGDPAGLAALDEALGSALGLATGGASETVLNLAGARGRILRLGRDMVGSLRERLGTADRTSRSERLAAAHAVLVVTAYFEELAVTELPFDWAEVRLTRREQLALAGAAESTARDFVHALTAAAPPMPAPHIPYERVLDTLASWYGDLGARLENFLCGLALWDRLNENGRRATREQIRGAAGGALRRYEELYTRLAGEIPEFAFWTHQMEHQTTRATVREALAGVASLLAGLSAGAPPVDVAAALSTAARAALSRPILADGDVPTGVGLPTVAAGYLDPRFRVRAVGGDGGGPADEAWWTRADEREDLSEYLAGALTSPGATAAPLVVLGQPGAGKSLLTKVLAARLPAAGFLPVRVVLREVPAEADVQDQIEYAIRSGTGERATWPDLVRAAPGLVPVILFDGFDELLQATGVSQSDFLERAAAFQQREADQGRPVIALVTTRTAVADRARFPEGSVALRLEPFSDEQIRTWVALWNRTNERYFAANGLSPLPASLVEQHRDLAGQPLLLLMLALYDATDNALRRNDGVPLDEADLYEDLLTAFAAREVGKSAVAPRPGEVADRVQQELERLSLVAFAMLNRRRQWVTADELTADLTALLDPGHRPESGFRAPLDQAEIALGRFFFVQRAQAVRDARRLATYEFLHATFGEYLAVRLAVNLLYGLLDSRPALLVSGPAPVADDLLYALLSYVPLSSRQMLRFVRARVAHLPEADREALADLVVRVIAANAVRTRHDHADYRPAPQSPTSSRHGRYEANLMLLMLALTGGFTARRVFPESVDPPGTWHRRALLWRSSLDEDEWAAFAFSLHLKHTWAGTQRELEVVPARDPADDPEPVDPNWLYGNRPERDAPERMSWRRTYWNELPRKMDVSGGTNDSVVRHALEPVVDRLGPELMTFTARADGRASSIAHDVLRVLLAGRTRSSARRLADAYRLCAVWLTDPWAAGVRPMVLGLLADDAGRLPADLVVSLLRPLDSEILLEAADTAELVLVAAVAALVSEPHPAARVSLLGIARDIVSLRQTHDVRGWQAWVTVHDHGLSGAVFGGQASQWLRGHALDDLPPALRHRIHRIAAVDYPDVSFPSPS